MPSSGRAWRTSGARAPSRGRSRDPERGTERIRNDHAGVGLGLAIAKSITQAHDGTIRLAPRPDGGLRVMVELPAAPYPNTEAVAPGGPASQRARRNVTA
jgi:hypothetical protein